ncbi:hypothetical protein TIN2_53 [Tsukamurella phage TIN2]|uniref:Uncharacterized protein n=1 Tax=Tsukamurella phage TIN2 TaxID=1636545 RepID=A0A0K0N5G9_9CAUD|nr:hypothetical protein AVT55_gp070 [Tsukamurella phage TIN2]AKJ71743.1 hypothetical protein TIN2_53 [Tsukamurella phage TIN2]
MPDDEVPEFAREAVEFQAFQQKRYEEAQREKEQNYNADLSAFAQFIDELRPDQLSYVLKLIEEIGVTPYAHQLIGIGVGSRIYRRGLMVDGKTYEEALGLVDEAEADNKPYTGPTDSTQPHFDPVVEAPDPRLSEPHVCVGCSRKYASLADYIETKEKHDGCPGCQHKEKWG